MLFDHRKWRDKDNLFKDIYIYLFTYLFIYLFKEIYFEQLTVICNLEFVLFIFY